MTRHEQWEQNFERCIAAMGGTDGAAYSVFLHLFGQLKRMPKPDRRPFLDSVTRLAPKYFARTTFHYSLIMDELSAATCADQEHLFC